MFIRKKGGLEIFAVRVLDADVNKKKIQNKKKSLFILSIDRCSTGSIKE